jgi:hypothetical protein
MRIETKDPKSMVGKIYWTMVLVRRATGKKTPNGVVLQVEIFFGLQVCIGAKSVKIIH